VLGLFPKIATRKYRELVGKSAFFISLLWEPAVPCKRLTVQRRSVGLTSRYYSLTLPASLKTYKRLFSIVTSGLLHPHPSRS